MRFMMESAPGVVVRASQLSQSVRLKQQDVHILKDISLSIYAGESVALVGVSGAGKSTLLGLLAGLDVPVSGTLELFSQRIERLSEDARAALRAGRLGFVFQDFQLLSRLTALENVSLPLELFADPREAVDKAKQLLGRVELSHRLHHFPSQLSGGEQQRVAIARAFITQPEILIADEPTGNLDQETGVKIIDLLFGMHELTGNTLIFATHDERLAARCQRIIRLDAGSILSDAQA